MTAKISTTLIKLFNSHLSCMLKVTVSGLI